MLYTETWVRQDIQQLVNTTFLDGGLYCNDDESNLLGVEMYDGTRPAGLSGACTTYAILGDDTSVTANGGVNGHKAWVILPSEFLAVEGPIQIALKVGTTTVGLFKGYVYRTATDDVVE